MDAATRQRGEFLIHSAYFLMVWGLLYLGERYLLGWILPFVLGYVIAVLLRPVALRLADATGLSRKLTGWCVTLGSYLLLGAALFLLGTLLAGQVQRAAAMLPSLYTGTLHPALLSLGDRWEGLLNRLSPGLASALPLGSLLAGLQDSLFALSANVIGWLGSITAGFPDFLMTFLFTIACSLLISTHYQETSGFIARQLPPPARQMLFSLKEGAGIAALGYCKAYCTLMLITFAQLAGGLLLLGVEGWFSAAASIALLDLLPLVGTGVVLLPWAVFSLLQGDLPFAAGIGFLYAIIIGVRGILEPKVVGRQLGLHPIVSLCAVYLGYRTMGVTGMVIMPVTVQLLVSLHKSGAVTLWK